MRSKLEDDANEFYVYLLKNSKNNEPFYVGKGKGDRCKSHMREGSMKQTSHLYKTRKIKKIWENGNEVKIVKITKNKSEKEALKIEEEKIEEIGLDNLTNVLNGGRERSGKNNPMYGKERSEEVKQKLSDYWKGCEVPDERKERISKSLKEKFENNPEYKEKVSHYGEDNGFYGESHSEDSRREMSINSSKFSHEEMKNIKWIILNTDYYQKDIAEYYNLPESVVSRIKNDKEWKFINPSKPDNFEQIPLENREHGLSKS